MTLSLIGIVLAVVVFVMLAFRRMNILFNTIIAAIVIVVASSLPILETLKTVYMAGFSAFMKGYFMLFMLSGIFGKLMSDIGAARSIAIALAKLVRKSKKHQEFFTILILPLFYFILSFAGVSGFVLVFTVISIGRELFEECNIPWKFYCYGSAGIYPAIVLGGSAYATNIIATNGYGVAPTAAMGLSIVLTLVIWLVLCILIKIDVNRIKKSNEGFLPSGEHIKKLQIGEQMKIEDLPNTMMAAIPVITPIVMIIGFGVDVLIALTSACAVSILVFFINSYSKRKSINKDNTSEDSMALTTENSDSKQIFLMNIELVKKSISGGITSAGIPLIYVSGAVGLTSIIKAAPGFTLVVQMLEVLPGLYGGIIMVMLATGVVASSSSSLPTFLPDISAQMMGSGISAEVAARMTAASGITYMTPHNPGVINAVELTRIDFKKAAWIYFKSTTIPGVTAVVVGIILISLGIF